MLIDKGQVGDDLEGPEQNFALDLYTSFDPDAILPYMQGVDLNETFLYMPRDDADSSILSDMGNDDFYSIDTDDTVGIFRSASGDLLPQTRTIRSLHAQK